MPYTSIELAEQVYKHTFGEVDKSFGYSISSKYVNKGVEVCKWYSPNEYKSELEHVAFFRGGVIYNCTHLAKQIGTYTEQ